MLLRIKNIIKNIRDAIFIFLAKATKTNLIIIGYKQNGILRYGKNEEKKEIILIKKVLNKLKIDRPIIFDVGANIGNYSTIAKKEIPGSTIFSFEPNPDSYSLLKKKINDKNIKIFNIALGNKIGENFLYDYKEKKGSEHASIYKDVIEKIHGSKQIEEKKIKEKTLDHFCYENKIEKINLLKIDTEGSEFNVLEGAHKMIKENRIDVIQFEFNEMNTISKVFLKDFYKILKNYNIFRMSPKKLISLPEYKTLNEIFQYQNFIAINKNKNQ